MKTGPKSKASNSQATGSGTSARASSAPKPPASTGPPPVPPRSPQKQAKGSFGSRVNRGYTPQSPLGDEPPVTSNNYFTTRTRPDLFSETSAAAQARRRDPPNPIPTADPPAADPPAADPNDGTYVDTRQRTPYRTPGGEKLDPFQGANVNRSRSTRESTRGAYRDDEDASPSPRQRSASSPHDPEPGPEATQGGKEAYTGGNSGSAAQASSNSTSESQYPPQESPNDGNESAMPDAHDANTSESAGSGDKDNSKLYASQPDSHFPEHEASQKAQQAKRRAGDEKIFKRRTSHVTITPKLRELLARQSSSEDKPTGGDGLNIFDHKMHKLLRQLSARKYSTSHEQGTPPLGGNKDAAQPQNAPQKTSNADNNNTNSFDFQYADNSFTPDPQKFTRNSADNINTRFVADEGDATNWQFNAGSPVSETRRPSMPRSKSGSRIGRKSPFHAQATQVPFTEPANGTVPPQTNSFNPEDWSEKIGPQIFQAPGQAQKANTIRPIRNPSKKLKPVRMTAGTAGMVESDENSSGQEDVPQKAPTPAEANEANGVASPNAMDIDNPLETNGVRNIHVEPSRPEWRAGDVKGMKTDANPATIDSHTGMAPPVGGSEDSEEFRATFADLRNVEPFAQPPTGLDSFGDMKSNLPFPSSAAGQAPVQKPPSKPIKLVLPEPPKPPNAPPTFAVHGLKPSATAWVKYAGDFCNYLAEWQAFNTKYTDHFQARNVEMHKKMANTGWVGSRDGAGMQEYLVWGEQDRQVRAKWTNACSDHDVHVQVFAAHRDRMMN